MQISSYPHLFWIQTASLLHHGPFQKRQYHLAVYRLVSLGRCKMTKKILLVKCTKYISKNRSHPSHWLAITFYDGSFIWTLISFPFLEDLLYDFLVTSHIWNSLPRNQLKCNLQWCIWWNCTFITMRWLPLLTKSIYDTTKKWIILFEYINNDTNINNNK